MNFKLNSIHLDLSAYHLSFGWKVLKIQLNLKQGEEGMCYLKSEEWKQLNWEVKPPPKSQQTLSVLLLTHSVHSDFKMWNTE